MLLAVIEKREGKIPLLHPARVVLDVHLGEQFEKLRNRWCCGSADGCKRLGCFDAEPQVAFGQKFPQRIHGGCGSLAQCSKCLTRAVAGFQRGGLQHFQQS